MPEAPLLEVENLSVVYHGRRGPDGARQAVAGVSLRIEAGRTAGVVGASGSGKSSLGLAVAGLLPPAAGKISRARSAAVQMVFQDPEGSLNPVVPVGRSIAEAPLMRARSSADRRLALDTAQALAARVGLDPSLLERRPRMLSGGQRQRVAIARALAADAKIMVLDEPTSALDVSIQAQVLDLLLDLQAEFGLAYLLISHDIAVVRHMADEIHVMQAGRFVESGPAAAIVQAPRHPYTRALLNAAGLGGRRANASDKEGSSDAVA